MVVCGSPQASLFQQLVTHCTHGLDGILPWGAVARVRGVQRRALACRRPSRHPAPEHHSEQPSFQLRLFGDVAEIARATRLGMGRESEHHLGSEAVGGSTKSNFKQNH